MSSKAGTVDEPYSSSLVRVERPRFDQSPSNAADDTSTVETLSHAPTTMDSQMEGSHTGSVYSYRSTRDRSQFVEENFGRLFNVLNKSYLLPTDELEWKRLDQEHCAILVANGSLVPCPEVVDRVLASNGQDVKRILDVGCGTGSWAIEMAKLYPEVQVRAVDIAPPPVDVDSLPANLIFEVDDINNDPSDHSYSTYDLIHMRLVSPGITDFEKTLRELALCLKPGGLLLIVDADTHFQDENGNKVKFAKLDGDEDVSGVSEDGSYIARLHWEQTEGTKIFGSDWDKARSFVDLGLWNQSLLDPSTAGGGSVYLPVGPWASSSDPTANQSLKYVGIIMRQVIANIHRTINTTSRRFGIKQEVLDEWTRLQDEELEQQKFHYTIRFPFCWARRRAGEGLPAPPLPPPPSNARLASGLATRLPPPFWETYHTPEEACEAREKREATVGVLPTAIARAWLSKRKEEKA